MGTSRRLTVLLAVAALTAAPAAVLRAACAGRACPPEQQRGADIPFCSLNERVREVVAAGFREGRSPEVLAVTGKGAAVAGPGRIAWPSEEGSGLRVPLVFHGAGVSPGPLPAGVTLDRVAPTVAAVTGLRRPHPEVRSGTEIPGVASAGDRPRLVLLAVLHRAGSAELEAAPGDWPFLEGLLNGGAGTLDAGTGSAPVDPAAVMTTLGTGGLPFQHGITGSAIRNDSGELVEPWSERAPVSVIATLADDMDEQSGQRARIGAVLPGRSDRGVVGGNWYVDNDLDDITHSTGAPSPAAILRTGYGRDGITDLLAVALTGTVAEMDAGLRAAVTSARRAAPGSLTVVVAGTGSPAPAEALGSRAVVSEVERAVGAPVVQAAVAGGLFLDQKVLAERKIAQDRVIAALKEMRDAQGRSLFADVFPALAVSFARYC